MGTSSANLVDLWGGVACIYIYTYLYLYLYQYLYIYICMYVALLFVTQCKQFFLGSPNLWSRRALTQHTWTLARRATS